MAIELNNSILDSIKKSIGILPDYTEFDDQILICINAALSTLKQLGYGPSEGYEVADDTTLWSDIITSKRFAFIKSYIILKVRTLFDPPTNSFALDAMNKQIGEYEWRINSEVESYGE